MICDEMGLGKTIQAIAIACCYSAEWPLLIIVPSSLKHNWRKELNRWVPEHAALINVIDSTRQCHFSAINIVSYDLVPRIQAQLEAEQFKVVIADESHYLKNREAQRTQAVLPLLKQATRRVLLTGTPALSRPAELWPQLDALDCGIFSSFKQFGARYCAAWQGPWGMDYSGSSHLSELHTVLHECVMIRRLKANVLTELPDKQRNVVYLEADPHLSEEIKREMRSRGAWEEIDEQRKKAIMSQLFMQTGRAKISAVCQYVVQLLTAEPEHKLLVFAHHMEVLDGLQHALEEQHVTLVRIDGSVDQQQRQALVDQFQRSHEHPTRVALLSLTCGSFGFTLTAAQRVVFAELWWTPGQLLQAEDRAHRIGRADATQPVLIDYCLARGTMDDMIWPLIAKKLSVVGTTLNGIRGQLDIEERIDMRSAALLRAWQELGEDPIHEASEEEESAGDKKKKKQRGKKSTHTARGKKKTRSNNNNNTNSSVSSTKKQRTTVELSSDDVLLVDSEDSEAKNSRKTEPNTPDKYLQRTTEDKHVPLVYRDPLALFRTPQPSRDHTARDKLTRAPLTVAPVARSHKHENNVKSEPQAPNISARVVIDLDDSDEHVPEVTPVKSGYKRKLDFDADESRKKRRVEPLLATKMLAARNNNNNRSAADRSAPNNNRNHEETDALGVTMPQSTSNTLNTRAGNEQRGDSEEELFGLSDFDLGDTLTAPVSHATPVTPVTPKTNTAVRSSAPMTPFRLFSSPSLSDQTKKRISLSLQKIT